MIVTILGDRRTMLPANWTKETIVSVLGDARIDASAGRVNAYTLFGDLQVSDRA